MTYPKLLASVSAALALTTAVFGANAQSFTEGFDNGGPGFTTGWVTANNSAPAGSDWLVGTSVTDGDGAVAIAPQAGFSFAIVNYLSLNSGTGTISNWLISPLISNIRNGDSFSFFTTTVAASGFPDRLEFRLSTAGASANVGSTPDSVGSFSTLLLSINPALDAGGYPEDWTRFTATVSGLATPMTGRVGFRYFVSDGGPDGDNSNVIGLDTFSYVAAAVPEPASWALMLAGAAGLAGLQRLRLRRKQA